MPRRWLSVRSQRVSEDVVSVIEDQFDFDFVTNAHDPVSPLTPVTPKATMFTSSPFRSRKNKNVFPRPESSNGPKAVDKRLQLTKVEDDWIGVAFGSPTHPPAFESGVSTHQSGATGIGNSPSPSSTSSAMYRKLGNLFKSKSGPMYISSPTNVHKIDGDQKIGMPIARKPLPNPKTSPDSINAENPAQLTSSHHLIQPFIEDKPLPRLTPLRLPKLEIQIPNAGLDRYSVMFGNVAGIKPSSLLERRSRLHNANTALLEEAAKIASEPSLLPNETQQPTTPTHRRKSSTYSLFPSPPKSRGSTHSSPDRSLPQRQLSYSSKPSFISTSPPKKPISKSDICRATPQRTDSEISFTSPDETVASSERNDSPWRSTDSLHSVPSSHTSVGSEIFFDIKPAVDGNGREQSQYVFQEPDRPAVELAKSNSRKARKARNKSREENQWETPMGPDLQAAEYVLNLEQKWRLSLELNQAIEDIERLTSPSGSDSPQPETVKIEKSHTKVAPQHLLPPVKFRRRLDGLAIGIPSPITERSEELSPCLTPSNTAVAQPRQHIASLCIRPAPLTISNESLTMIQEFAITPPPVPVKDAKYLPISKSTTTDSSIKLVEYKARHPKPRHTAEDTSSRPKRSRSIDIRKTYENLQANKSSKPLNEITRKQLPSKPTKRVETGIIAVSVKPAAEVSIARTISLQRKQSHQISVSSPRAGAANHIGGNISLTPGRSMSPTCHEDKRFHQPGASLDVLVEKRSVAERRKVYES